MPEFVPLTQFVRPQPRTETVDAGAPDFAATIEIADVSGDLDDALSAARRFRAALDDALETAVETLLRDVAASVIARELELAPADVRAIVAAARERYRLEEPVRVRVHPEEVAALRELDLCVAADPALRRGDVEIDVRDGTIDATLGARLERVLHG